MMGEFAIEFESLILYPDAVESGTKIEKIEKIKPKMSFWTRIKEYVWKKPIESTRQKAYVDIAKTQGAVFYPFRL